ncbi:MAG: hypothetical protein K2X39_00750, partial [Silvanigrellaceae bacterium]|nr:hypothetical protein [Silvanigrellaceae bacterium]
VKFSVALVVLRILSSNVSLSNVSAIVTMFWVFAVLSIIIGSLFGLVHNSVKRMLAYSSIANAGYLSLAFASIAANPLAQGAKHALIVYGIIYAILSMGAFTVIAWVEDQNREDLLKEELSGLGKAKPFAAMGLTVFLLGLGGIPPLAGFIGKFLLLSTAISNGFIILSLILAICSSISLYYYLSLIASVWFKSPTPQSVVNNQSGETNLGMKFLTALGILAALWIGILGPQFVLDMDITMASELELGLPKN